MRKLYTLLLLTLLSGVVFAQQRTLTGVVSSADGPILGATISVEGTTRATVSNLDGDFELEVSSGETIEVSYIGYEPYRIVIGSQTHLDITLVSSTKDLDEVIVVGYGKQKKATLTGAVSAIGSEKLVKSNVASLSNALQGQMPGVTIQQTSGEPGADGGSIRIRGIGSINSSQSPLVLVDGIEMSIDQVDMNSVESISVLKDAASASIYGSRASNGVVLITTKRGVEGKTNVTYSGYMTIQQPTNMPDPVSAADYLGAELAAMDNAGVQITDQERQRRLSEIEHYKTYQPDNWNYYDTDWKGETIANSSTMHNHNITLSGGSENVKFFGSGTYLKQDGLIENNNYERANLRLNVDTKITDWMKFSVDGNMRQSTAVSPAGASSKGIINQALYMLPMLSAATELDGNWGYGKNGLNPAAMAAASGTSTSKGYETVLNGTLTITPVKDLVIVGQYSLRNVSGRGTYIRTPYTVSLKGNVLGEYPGTDGVTESWNGTVRNYYRAQANYTKQIDKHNIGVMLGAQAEDNSYSSFNASMMGFEFEKYYLSNGDASTASAAGGANDWSMASVYTRLNYSYDDKYIFEFSGRYDGSSRFTSSNRWGFFPSGSAAWVITRESWMESTHGWLDFLKLRVSYGELGNQSLSNNYPYASTINTGYGYWFDKELWPGVAQTSFSNENISWETSTQFDVGVDANFFSNRLTLTADYYVKTVNDMLLMFPLPYYAGLQPAWSNAGSMKNEGWELALGWKETRGDWSYGVNLTLSDNRNEVTDLKGLTTQDRSLVVGYPSGGHWGYVTDGYYQDWDDVASSPLYSSAARPGYVKYVKTDPNSDQDIISQEDMVYLGDPFPHYEYGVTLNAAWRGFDLQAFFQGVGERATYMTGVGLKPFANGANLFSHQMDWWTPENPNAEYPIIVPEANAGDNYLKSDKWVRNGAYLRLKNLVLGYSLPDKIVKRWGLSQFRVYLSGQNVFTISDFYDGYDPEVSYSGSVGGEFYPVMRTYTVGVDVKF